MSTIVLSQFVEENETAETRAYKHALDISYKLLKRWNAKDSIRKCSLEKWAYPPPGFRRCLTLSRT